MSTKYRATEIEKAYFITITTVGWVDVFMRLNQKQVIINEPQSYYISSARNYADLNNDLDLEEVFCGKCLRMRNKVIKRHEL